MPEEIAKQEEIPESTIDISEVDVSFFDDPIPTHLTRMLVLYEDAVTLEGYDAICVDCLGDKRVLAFEFLPDQAEEAVLCKKCKGTGRISRENAE
jgi:hypothetical protein